jgi:hypothetical protein
MEIQRDFKELLALFNAHKVQNLIVGAHALAFHGSPRYTGDLDLFVEPGPDNAARILKALDQFGFGSQDISVSDFQVPDKVVQLGVPPVRIDLVTSLTGVSWEEAADGAVPGRFGDVAVRFLGRNELIRNKRALGRKKDLADLEALGEE